MTALLHDAVHGFRLILRQPVRALVAVSILALGVGATSALYSVVRGVLLETLPFERSDELVHLMARSERTPTMWVAWENFLDWRDRNRVFSHLAAHRVERRTLGVPGSGPPESVIAVLASAELFPLLGVAPARGRVYDADDDRVGGAAVAVVSHGFWQRRLGGAGDVLERDLLIDGERFRIVAVMPPGFLYPREFRRAELWLPIGRDAADWGRRHETHPGVAATGRLRPGVTLAAARADLDRVAAELAALHPDTNAGRGVAVRGVRDRLVEDLRPALRMLAAAVALLLVLAAVNVATLLLAQGAARRRELAVRRALGASRGRIVRQMLAESVVLSAVAAVAGVGVAYLALDALRAAVDVETMPAFGEIAIDAGVLIFALAVGVLAGLAAGVAPALGGGRDAAREALREGAGSSPDRRRRRLLDALVVAQIALALALGIGALLAGRSFFHLAGADPGFDPDGVLSLVATLPDGDDAEPATHAAFFAETLERIRALPGVRAAATSMPILVGWSASLRAADGERAPDEEDLEAEVLRVSPGYFETLGIRVLDGRGFEARDRLGAAEVAVVDERLAETLWPGRRAVGRRLHLAADPPERPGREVVGVAAAIHNRGLQRESRRTLYLPAAQAPDPYAYLLVRTDGDPRALVAPVEAALRAREPDLVVDEVATVAELWATRSASERLLAVFLATFATLALVLAAAGTYGILAHAVAARRREIALRIAAGARRDDVVWLVVRRGLALAAAGISLGLVLAALGTPLLAGQLHGVALHDPATWLLLPLLLLLTSLAACVAPARRASLLEPAEILRAG